MFKTKEIACFVYVL